MLDPELLPADFDERTHSMVRLENIIRSFGVQVDVTTAYPPGPFLVRYGVVPHNGVRVDQVMRLANDIARCLGVASVTMQAPNPGTNEVGIEVPRANRRTVELQPLWEHDDFFVDDGVIIPLGVNPESRPIYADLTKFPHAIVAGVTGSGKSNFLNVIICSLIFRYGSHQVRLALIDPKRVEFSIYNQLENTYMVRVSGLPTIATEPTDCIAMVRSLVDEVDYRSNLFHQMNHVRSLGEFNKTSDEKLPVIVAIIDELADLIDQAGDEVNQHLKRLGQVARAMGIHVIIGTQRPSVDVISGTIKGNYPTRLAFRTSTAVDSKVIIDGQGAEKLLGDGDMLYLANGQSKPIRIHTPFISSDQIKKTVKEAAKHSNDNIYELHVNEGESRKAPGDPLIKKAVSMLKENPKLTVNSFMIENSVGFNRASKILKEARKLL